MHRVIVATAGLELFIVTRSSASAGRAAPYEIGSDKIDHQLRSLFGNSVRRDFLPQQNPTSVHDSYIEILAEAGAVGFACFVALLVVAIRGIRSVLRSVAGDRRTAACAWCAAVLLVGVLVWWNDNALFGAQPETVLAATFLGILAATRVSIESSRDRERGWSVQRPTNRRGFRRSESSVATLSTFVAEC